MKRLRNENGYSLLLVFFVLMFISIAGISLLTVSANSLKTSSNERTDQSIYYIAEAGLNFKKAEMLTSLRQAEEMAMKEVDKLQRQVINGQVIFSSKEEARNAYNTLYKTTVKSELKQLLLKGESKITTQYNTFETSNYKSPPYSIVTIKLTNSDNDLIYNLESSGYIEGKRRKVITKIEIEPQNMDIIPGPPISSPGGGTGGGNNGAGKNPYEDSFFNKDGTNLVVTTPPNLNGKAFRDSTKDKIIDGYVLNVTRKDGENFESAVTRAVSVIADPVIRELNKQYLTHKNACESNNFGDSEIFNSLSTTKKNPQNIKLTNNVVYIKGDISLDKAALTLSSASPVNIVVCGSLKGTNGKGSELLGKPATNINLFVMGEKTNINNIALQTNYVFAPTTSVDFGGNVGICSTLLVNSFTGKGAGSYGGFTSGCSKPTLLDPPIDTNPSPDSTSPSYLPSNRPLTSSITSDGIIED